MLITVAIPTHNRPALLRETLISVAAQTYVNWEVVVVDDGSTPPVFESTLRELIGERFILVRHDQAQGIASAKNAGVALARGEVIFHLDDDDLLSTTALEHIASAYARHPELECLFVNVEPFGALAPGTAANQSQALSRLLERAQGREENGIIFFHSDLFAALLKSVPMAMQHPAARKNLWDKVGPLRKDSYLPEPEWAMKSALACKPALLQQYAYLARMDGQNYVSRTTQKEKHMLAAIDIRNSLLTWITENPAFAEYTHVVKHSLADVYFDIAHHRQRSGNGRTAWRALIASLITHPKWRIMRLALRLIFPQFKCQKVG